MQLVPVAHGAARRRRPGAGRRRHLPGRRRAPAARRSRELEGQVRGPRRRASRTTSPSTRTRSPSTRCPQIDVFLDNGYTKEEWKVVTESRKILHLPDLRVARARPSGSRCSSPTREAVHVETARADRAGPGARAVRGRPRRRRPGRPGRRTTTRSPPRPPARDEIFVGRVRQDASIADGRGLAFWVVSATTSARARPRTRSRSPRSSSSAAGSERPRAAPAVSAEPEGPA